MEYTSYLQAGIKLLCGSESWMKLILTAGGQTCAVESNETIKAPCSIGLTCSSPFSFGCDGNEIGTHPNLLTHYAVLLALDHEGKGD